MRITLNINDDLLKKASELTGIKGKSTLIKLGLHALIDRENCKKLSELGCTERKLHNIPRR